MIFHHLHHQDWASTDRSTTTAFFRQQVLNSSSSYSQQQSFRYVVTALFCQTCRQALGRQHFRACVWVVSSRTPDAYRSKSETYIGTEVVRERVQDGLTGETRDMQYTQCKIVGNGSFGVVFQTKLAPNGEDAAIKRVLQDKRFKVNHPPPTQYI